MRYPNRRMKQSIRLILLSEPKVYDIRDVYILYTLGLILERLLAGPLGTGVLVLARDEVLSLSVLAKLGDYVMENTV